MPSLESLKRDILTECEEDHVGLWSIIRDVEDYFPKKDVTAIREQTLEILRELLQQHEIKAGFPTETGKFLPLQISPEKVMERIEAEWPPDRLPTIGEGLWFTKAN
jgi:hypothetical protein